MINVIYYYNDNVGYYGLSVDGHALFNPGNDIVCSAVSALVQTLIYALEKFFNVEYDTFVYEKGLIKLIILPTDDKFTNEKISEKFEMVIDGLEMIAVNYPDNIQINKIPA